MPKFKVLRIIARLNIGGPAINAIILSAGLDRGKFETILITGRPSRSEGEMAGLLAEKKVSPVMIKELGREIDLWKDLFSFFKVYALIKKERPDIVHTHTAKAGALGRLAGALCGCKLVHTFHGHVLEGYFGRLKSRIFIWIERFLAALTDKIIVVSPRIKDELLRLKIAPENKISVMPLGLELEGLLALAPPQPQAPYLNIGIVGRLVPIKNHRLFLQAAAEIKDARLQFFIIGDGELRQDLEDYARELGLSGKVAFSGWQDDLAKVYGQLDLLTLTSLNEGTPVSIIEAMAAARPVIATDVGGVRDLLGDNERGRLVKSGDSRGLAEAIKKLAGNPALRLELGRQGRDFVRARFTKERLIKDIELLYNELLVNDQCLMSQ
jgi:glycosyltransferase involved in cell wall biosynthesis